jgi:hypothetical protein
MMVKHFNISRIINLLLIVLFIPGCSGVDYSLQPGLYKTLSYDIDLIMIKYSDDIPNVKDVSIEIKRNGNFIKKILPGYTAVGKYKVESNSLHLFFDSIMVHKKVKDTTKHIEVYTIVDDNELHLPLLGCYDSAMYEIRLKLVRD